MDSVLKRLREERVAAWNRAQEILKDAESRDGGLSGELLTNYEAADGEVARLSKEIELRERAAETEARLKAPVTETRPAAGAAPEARTTPLAESEEYRDAFYAMLRRGIPGISQEQRDLVARGFEEHRDLGVGTGSAGGYLVPQGFLVKITERLKYFGPVRQLANVIETASGTAMPWPNNDDTSNVATILGENTAVSLTDVTLGSKTLNSYVWATGAKASLQLLNDSVFDVETFLARKFGQRFGRGQNNLFTVGTGTAQPLGLTNNGAPTINTQLATGNATSFSTTAIAIGGLLDLQHSVDRAYRQPFPWVGYMMNDLTLKAIRKLSDSNGRPIWIPEQSYGSLASNVPGAGQTPSNSLGQAVAGAQGQLFGYPVFVNNDMATQAASAYTVAFGDFNAYYIVRDVVGIQLMRLSERYADQLQVGFLAFMRSDGRIDDSYAVGFLQQSAT